MGVHKQHRIAMGRALKAKVMCWFIRFREYYEEF